jgi:site-specific recombinase XerD
MNLEVLQSFINEYQIRYSFETCRSYKISITQFFTFCQKNYDEVKRTNIRAWLAFMGEKGLKPRTIHLKLSALKSFYQYCLEENLMKENPTHKIRAPHIDDSLPYYLTKRQIVLLQELTKDNLRERALVDTLYATGVRISELLQIKLEDVKWDTRQIWIRKGKGNKERFVLFTHDCTERLKAYLQHRKVDSEFLFSNRRGGH